MNYIINPSWFYWLGVVDALKVFFGIFVAFGTIGVIIILLSAHIDYRPEDKEYKEYMRCAKIVICGVVLCVIGLIFIPSKTTLIEIQVARYATYDNARWTVESIKSAVDYIVDAIKSMR